jgi:aminoglycoside phosphotransferase
VFEPIAKKMSGRTVGKHRLARVLYRYFPSFKQSAIAYSLFPSFFTSIGTIDGNAFCENSGRRGELSSTINKYFPNHERVVLLSGAASDPKQKLVAKVLNKRGVCVGYLKFGEKPMARQRVEAEARILKVLPAGCGPTFQGLETCDEYSCFAMGAVEGMMLEAKLPASVDTCQLTVVKEYLEQLKVSDELFQIDTHPAIVRLREQVAEIRGQRSEIRGQISEFAPDLRPLTSDLLDTLLAPLRTKKWPVVIQHGDFTPWNVLRSAEWSGGVTESGSRGVDAADSHTPILSDSNTSLVAIDWEEGTAEGFPHFDLIYYILQTAYFMHHWSPAVAVEYARSVICEMLKVERDKNKLHPTTCPPKPLAKDGSNVLHSTVADALIRLAALDAWLSGELGGLSGNPLQQFRLEIINRETHS